MEILEGLLELMILASSWLTDADEPDAEDGSKYEGLIYRDVSPSSMSVRSDDPQTGTIVQHSSIGSMMVGGRSDDSLLQRTASVSRRHNRDYVNTIGLLSNPLKTNENQFQSLNV